MTERPELSVIMPAFNEGEKIYDNIVRVVRSLERDGLDGFEVIVVDDGSSDNTFSEIKRASADIEHVIAARNYHNLGKGWALKTGFSRSSGQYVAFLDADLDIAPSELIPLRKKLAQGNHQVVIGSKMHPESKIDYPIGRKIFSFCYYMLIKILFDLPLRDTQTGIKLYRREVLDAVFPLILVKKFAFDIELLAVSHYKGFSIVDVPIIVDFQRGRHWGRIGLLDVVQIMLDTLAIFYRMKILGYYDRQINELREYPMVSIVIAVGPYNDNLVESINACLHLDYPNYEVLVYPDEPFEWNDDRVRVRATGKVDPSTKRDLAIEDARGEILAFLDDDAYPLTNWLKSAVRNFCRPEVAGVGGPAVTPPSDSIACQASGDIYASPLVGGTYTYRYIQGRYREVDDYPTCNLLVRKDVFEKVGGFDTRFWPGEDTFFCLKVVHELKLKMVYEPDALVYHHRRPVYAGHLRQIKSYALHRGYFVKHYPETSLKPAYFMPSALVLGVSFGWLTGFVWQPLFWFYAGVLGFYLLAAFLYSLLSFHPLRIWYTFSGIVASHFAYGIYFIRGLLARRLREDK